MPRLIDAEKLFQDLREHNIPFNADINEAIIVAPTVEAEPVRHGHWIAEISDEEEYKCSECGDKEYYTCNYCPNCGAKMDEVENG